MLADTHEYQLVLDEDSLRIPAGENESIAHILNLLADLLSEFTNRSAIMDHALSIECWEAVHFHEVCFMPLNEVPRDVRVRLARLVDKCNLIVPTDGDLPKAIELDSGHSDECSWGFAHAIQRTGDGYITTCLSLPTGSWAEGWRLARSDDEEVRLHILSSTDEVQNFWRQILLERATTDEQFFELAPLAFPNLVFAEGLAFRKFEASIDDTLPWVVGLLSAVNDRFMNLLARAKGDQNKIIAAFGGLGLDVSPESPRTRRNVKAWRQRTVSFDGRQIECEWHGKRSNTVDRVHFSLPLAEYQGKVLVGIFTDHLAT